ncbi:MAG: hypothetical protein MI673_10660 [Thiotrichales bacterium]|nr:hypothetical protein [Thiotrichales bacterium]
MQHADEGWDHYADAILVLAENGTLLGSRPLRHPHVGQAAFTRTVQVLIPDHIDRVIIRAHDSVHGLSGQGIPIQLDVK